MLERIKRSAANRASFIWDKIDGRDIYDQARLRPEDDEIRLLRLERDCPPTSVPLRCRFEVVSLRRSGSSDGNHSAAGHNGHAVHHKIRKSHERPAYSAVSYTWGQNPATTLMVINGRPVQVPMNTEIAARRLLVHRLREAPDAARIVGDGYRRSQTIYLWIDALCINQQDVREKSQQVAMMSHIYSSADEVLVWLGEVDVDEGRKLKQLLHDVYDDCGRATDNFAHLHQTLSQNPSAGVDVILHDTQLPPSHIVVTPFFTAEKWDLLTKFFSLGWFSRIWIIQEISLASRATMYWGDVSFAWPIASVAAAWIHHGRIGKVFVGSEPLTLAGARTMRHITHGVTLYERSAQTQPAFPGACQSGLTLSSALINLAEFDATDPRDNVYALLGLLSSHSREKSGALTPDYSSDVATVYTMTDRAYIDQILGIGFINQAGLHQASQSGTDILPSWVPHWGQAGRGFNGSCRQLWITVDSATFTPPLAIRETNGSPQILSAKGVSVDMVKHLGPSFSLAVNMPDCDEATRVGILRELGRQLTRADHFARVTSSGTSQYLSGYKESFLRTLFCGRTDHKDHADHDPYFISNAEALLQCFENLEADTIIPPTIVRLFHTLHYFCHNRTFFITSDGRFGMAPPGTREGDHIVFLFSHGWPFVLRRVEEHWVLLGDVYVDGLMSGSHWRELDQDDAEWMDIH